MKKLSLSLMLNVSLALMLALSLIYPQSVAVNFVAAWAILATVIRASPEQASMEFYGGRSPKIASVHQFGLSEENRKDGKKIDYPARPLLGFTGEDVQMIEEIILAHLDR